MLPADLEGSSAGRSWNSPLVGSSVPAVYALNERIHGKAYLRATTRHGSRGCGPQGHASVLSQLRPITAGERRWARGAWAHTFTASDGLIDLIHGHPLLADGSPEMEFEMIDLSSAESVPGVGAVPAEWRRQHRPFRRACYPRAVRSSHRIPAGSALRKSL
jgi:hypothetical protein